LVCYEPDCSLVKKGEFYSLFQLDLPDCYCGCVIDNGKKDHLPRYRIMKVKREELDESKVKGNLHGNEFILAISENTRFLGFGKKEEIRVMPYSPEVFEKLRGRGKK
jgi:hypothetical protein